MSEPPPHLTLDRSPSAFAADIGEHLARHSRSRAGEDIGRLLEQVSVSGRDDLTGITATLAADGTLVSVSLPSDGDADAVEAVAASLGTLVTALVRTQHSAMSRSIEAIAEFRKGAGPHE